MGERRKGIGDWVERRMEKKIARLSVELEYHAWQRELASQLHIFKSILQKSRIRVSKVSIVYLRKVFTFLTVIVIYDYSID